MSGTEVIESKRGGPGRCRVPRRVREREMVETAAQIFAERGYRHTSMEEVASACGVSKPMLYAYFGSKEGLFAACRAPAGTQLRAQLAQIGAEGEGEPAEQLWRGLQVIFERIEADRETWLLLYPPSGPPPGGPLGAQAALNRAAMAEQVEELMRRSAVAGGVDEAVAAAQITALAHAVVGAVIAVASWALSRPDESLELQALRVMNLIWKGLEGLRRGELWVPGAETG